MTSQHDASLREMELRLHQCERLCRHLRSSILRGAHMSPKTDDYVPWRTFDRVVAQMQLQDSSIKKKVAKMEKTLKKLQIQSHEEQLILKEAPIESQEEQERAPAMGEALIQSRKKQEKAPAMGEALIQSQKEHGKTKAIIPFQKVMEETLMQTLIRRQEKQKKKLRRAFIQFQEEQQLMRQILIQSHEEQRTLKETLARSEDEQWAMRATLTQYEDELRAIKQTQIQMEEDSEAARRL